MCKAATISDNLSVPAKTGQMQIRRGDTPWNQASLQQALARVDMIPTIVPDYRWEWTYVAKFHEIYPHPIRPIKPIKPMKPIDPHIFLPPTYV